MRDLVVLFISTAIFFLGLIAILVGLQKNIYRLPVYYYPNGLVLNINDQFKEFWGNKISMDDVAFAKDLNTKFSFAEHEVRIYDKNQSEQIGRFFFFNIKKFDIIRYFSADILTSLIAFITAFWFFYHIRDTYIFLFFLNAAALLLCNFLYIAFDEYFFFFTFFLFMFSFSLLNLSFRFRGKEIPTKYIIPQLVVSAVMGFVIETESENFDLVIRVGFGGLILLLGSIILSVASIVYDIGSYHQQKNILIRKMSLIFSLLLLGFVPVTIVFYDPLGIMAYDRLYLFIIFLVFLSSFIYGTYRYSLVPIQVFFNPTIVALLLVSSVVGTYIVLAFILKQYLSIQILIDSRYFNVFFLLITIIYLIPIRSAFRELVNYYSFKKNANLAASLEKISSQISSPISMKSIVGGINRNMMETLNVNQIMLLIPGDQFANADLRNINFTRISTNSEIWKYFLRSKEVTVTSHLTYGVGLRESLFQYLSKMGIQIAFPIRDSKEKKKNKAILLIGEKVDKQNFSLGELRYIREVSRLASMLLDNYSLLADEIEKKKIMRKLHTASVLDHTLNLIDSNPSEYLRIGYFSIPAVEISGDYLDIINLNPEKVAIFLGDVSGHGLGTGYIVTAIKAITRDMINTEDDLEKIFVNINHFLKEKYGGNEFMTLLGGILNTKTQTFTYINAGHPGLIVVTEDGYLKPYNKTQRVLGILETEYKTGVLQLNNAEKLIIYSDGVTETFGEGESMFGEETLYDVLRKNYHLSADEMPLLLQDRLEVFRKGKELTDDSTFVAIELLSKQLSSDSIK
ncbi:PP2C family protein-serine/threonine phosphatase [Leptospira sp. GIMC2001]|uniref:PP2C family protein-serine/threonine phosphatase n=1 Tax=Leptospira sp. GIMC2001 TaxID=1513297 RepID=UPI00234BE945|nr:PP2C family protein-serine/threonine phosphatase [Leptospira sp. GIMC2001]WCL48964.1 PP2C family protein-serine/threonine phosphatase [Leptospira sp. GIMC2001]